MKLFPQKLLVFLFIFLGLLPVPFAEATVDQVNHSDIAASKKAGESSFSYSFDLFENKNVAESGNPTAGFSDSEFYVCSEKIDLKTGQQLSTSKGIEFRAIDAGSFKAVFNWRSEQLMSKDIGDVYIIFRRADKKALPVDSLLKDGISYTDFPFHAKKENGSRFDLNITGVGQEDLFWCPWFYPQAVSFNGVNNCLYWGFVSGNGDAGVACRNFDTGIITKNVLKSFHVDVHDSTCVFIKEDGTIICAYPGGHNEDKQIHIRISSKPESIDDFLPDQPLNCSGWVSYCQIIQNGGKYVMAYRLDANRWAYRLSDDCIFWGDERIFVSTSLQYYCLFRPTTVDGIIRVVMYPNPSAKQHDIRMGFYDVFHDTILNADCKTVLGNADVPYSDFDVLIPQDPHYSTQRLMDCAVTAPLKTMILYAPFTGAKSKYRIYDDGIITDICDGGQPLWTPKYQLGLAWIGTDQIVVARGEKGKDIIELYKYADGKVSLGKAIYEEDHGVDAVRNAWPIVDTNNRYYLWGRGYFNSKQYKDFCMDTVIASVK